MPLLPDKSIRLIASRLIHINFLVRQTLVYFDDTKKEKPDPERCKARTGVIYLMDVSMSRDTYN